MTRFATILIMVLTMTAGTGLIMWFGELITDRGVGNGMSLLIFISIAAAFPTALWAIKDNKGWGTFLGIILLGMFVIAAVVFVEQSQRRIPVQYAKRMVRPRMYGGTSTYIPLKVNMANVIPVIFAASLIGAPGHASRSSTRTRRRRRRGGCSGSRTTSSAVTRRVRDRSTRP